jgi:F0F1-type ATP synthase membrane subunit c/vacuolar-type H+-ATPase subunit K
MASGLGRRPAAVTITAGLMALMALLGVVGAIASLAIMNRLVDRFRERAARTDASANEIDTIVGIIRAFSIISAIIGILIALVLIGLALGNLRGSNASRIATWALCGIGIVCGCCGLFGVLAQNNAAFSGMSDDRTAEDLGRALADASPGWWTVLSGALSVGQALGYIAVAVLLALPAASAFFRKPAAPPWQPTTPPTPPPSPTPM